MCMFVLLKSSSVNFHLQHAVNMLLLSILVVSSSSFLHNGADCGKSNRTVQWLTIINL